MKDLTKSELETIFTYLGWMIIDDEDYPPEDEEDPGQRLMLSHEWEANNPKSCIDLFLSSLETKDVIATLEAMIPSCGTGQKNEFKMDNESQIRLTIHVLKTTACLDDFAEDIRKRALRAGFNLIAFDPNGKTMYEMLRNETLSVKSPLLVFAGEGEDVFTWYDPKPHEEDEMREIRCTAVSLNECKTSQQIAQGVRNHRDAIKEKAARYQAEIDASPDWIENDDERCRISGMAEYCDEAEHQLPMLDALIAELEKEV